MKILAAIFLSLLFCFCSDADSDTYELNQRITRLEQRIDSLTHTPNVNTVTNSNQSAISENNRCQGITKKGARCKRKAKTNGYCWQHGG